MVTLELEPRHAEVARANFVHAGLADRIEVMVGPAAESLAKLRAARAGPFDLVFIDADKASSALYLEGALAMSRPGTLVVIDNVVRGGAVADDGRSGDPTVAGVRRVLDAMAADARLECTAIQTVGSKGYDGFAMARVR